MLPRRVPPWRETHKYRQRAVAVFIRMDEDGAVVMESDTNPEGAPGWRIFRPDALHPPY